MHLPTNYADIISLHASSNTDIWRPL